MQQSNAPRRLETILDEAVSTGEGAKKAGMVLLETMQLDIKPHNIIFFNYLLSQTLAEAKMLEDIPKIDRYLQKIEILNDVFVVNHVWSTEWKTFTSHIESSGVLIALDAVANYIHDRQPTFLIEADFLNDLTKELELQLEKTLSSTLPIELKRFLSKHIQKIVFSVRAYRVDGTEGLKKAVSSFVSDIAVNEHSFNDKDKKNPSYRGVKALSLSLLLYLTPSPWDVIGAGAALHDFWVPKFGSLVSDSKEMEGILGKTSSIEDALREASDTFKKQSQNILPGSNQVLSLPSGKKDSETIEDSEIQE